MTVYRLVMSALKKVPNSNHVTEVVCDKFSGYLQVDAKYISVRGRQTAFIWAIDYYTHDIVWHMLVPTENSLAYLTLFKRLRSVGYELKGLTCDEHPAILGTVNLVFPNAVVQICIVHYLRNVRYKLNLKEQDDIFFLKDLKGLLLAESMKEFSIKGRRMMERYREKHQVGILVDVARKESYLTTHIRRKRCPATSNLIECYNKHLNGRLRKLDGFKSYHNAEIWLNGYVMYKRSNALKSCKGKFKRLNGHSPLSLTAEDNVPGISMLKRE